ncbi:hypothetical protein CVT25_015388 [Psilocybe cyanescens]|uniref:Uncharacterized protein n=1 Tax=Psilocybe cyanescens TaxID=93625 RepID=A0A409WHE4_PSICY|nr:hypothetical protein CVT25_015388 [Psilocybe cyanescens]
MPILHYTWVSIDKYPAGSTMFTPEEAANDRHRVRAQVSIMSIRSPDRPGDKNERGGKGTPPTSTNCE